MMEQAARDADQAAGILTNAFAMVPAAVRQRYPAQCAQIGHVQVPLLSQTDFGNKMMEFFGGGAELFAEFNSGNKIRRNMAIVNQCKSVAHSQEQTVRALEAQLLRDADEARRQLQLTTQHLEAEKDQIMAALRNAMMQGFPQAAPAVPMTMMPAAPPAASRLTPICLTPGLVISASAVVTTMISTFNDRRRIRVWVSILRAWAVSATSDRWFRR